MNPVHDTSIITFVLLAVAMPALSCVLCLLIPRRFMWVSAMISTLLMFVAVIAAGVLYARGWHTEIEWRIPWLTIGTNTIDVIVLADDLSLPMLSMVVLISFLVHLYSVGFMADDHQSGRYFAFLGFFTFSMLGVVMSGNILITFCFWELVGFSSYLLIGHYREKKSAGAAATKAFLVNRIGDAFFIVGLALTYAFSNTFDVATVDRNGYVTFAALCIFGGIMGKSAQFPLLTWLPDAMEGPTPVSALIHAATMVAAGIFLILRIPFILIPSVAQIIGVVGGITAVYGGYRALQQYDLKKILAYSTISQLGLMMMVIGAGNPQGAFIHLLAHAFFKACLFLAAGAIIHSLYHVAHQNEFNPQDIRNMGGLFKVKPRVFIATTVALAAICGLPLFSGFISKEMMIVPMIHRALERNDWMMWIYVIVFFVSSMLTILYSYRLYVSVFFGPRTTPFADLTPIPAVMQWPVSLLAVLSLWIFFSLSPFGPGMWLWQSRGLNDWSVIYPGSGVIAMINIGWIVLSMALAWLLFTRKKVRTVETSEPLDNLYNKTIIAPSLHLSDSLAVFDKKAIDGVLHIIVFGQVALAKIAGYFDRYVVDGTVSAISWTARATGNLLRSTGGGRIQSYLAWSAVALIIFIFWLLK